MCTHEKHWDPSITSSTTATTYVESHHITLARELEGALGLATGMINARALRNAIVADWHKLSSLVHKIHDAAR